MYNASLFCPCNFQKMHLLFPVYKGFIRTLYKITDGFYPFSPSACRFPYIRFHVLFHFCFQILSPVLTPAFCGLSGISRFHKAFHFLHGECVISVAEMTVQFHFFSLVYHFLQIFFAKT